MIKNRKIGHIGLEVANIEETVKWYMDVLGFELIGSFTSEVGEPIRFIKSGDLVYEIWEPVGCPVAHPGKLDHMCFESHDIEADYRYCQEQGYQFEEEGIQEMDIWENGVRFFKIMSPSGEAVEFCQIL